MKIKLELLEKLLSIILSVVQAIGKLIDKDDDAESDRRDAIIAEAVRTKFPNVNDVQLLAEIAKANEVNEIIDLV